MSEKDIYFGEVLMNGDVRNGDSVLVKLGGNASPAMWNKFVETLQQKGAVALRMKVKQTGKQQERHMRQQEMMAELMQWALDDMQERAQEGMLILLDDDGNAHTISPMQEDYEESDQPTNPQDKLAQLLRRVEKWAQQESEKQAAQRGNS